MSLPKDLGGATGFAQANTARHGVTLAEAFWVWLRVAALSFGGPAGQIAVMHRILVDEKRWIGEARFLHALSYFKVGMIPTLLSCSAVGIALHFAGVV